jgi:hypothetical protein
MQKYLKSLCFRWLAGISDVNFDNYRAVAVYPEQNLVYNRIKKAANTMIVASINESIGSGHQNIREVKSSLKTPIDLTLRECRQFPDYFSFTVVRNPYTRALSAYLQKIATGTRHRFSSVPSYGVESKEGFRHFIAYLEAGGLHENRHWGPQTALLFMPPERFDYIGRFERLEDELRLVFNRAGLVIPPSLDLARLHPLDPKDKYTGASQKVAEYYDDELLERVYLLYSDDFAAFGYEKGAC